MSGKYILDSNGEPQPCDNLLRWSRWFETADRKIAKTQISEDVEVSTVFLGLNHSFGDGPPLIYETMVFGGEHDGEMNRYSTREESLKGHKEMVRKCEE